MNKDELNGKAEAIKGKMKQAAGDLTDNERLHDEGVADEAAGETQETMGRGRRKVGEAIEDLGDKIKRSRTGRSARRRPGLRPTFLPAVARVALLQPRGARAWTRSGPCQRRSVLASHSAAPGKSTNSYGRPRAAIQSATASPVARGHGRSSCGLQRR